MAVKDIQQWVDYLKEKEDSVPELLDDEKYVSHWTGRLYIGKTLFKKYKEYQGAYDILREIYVNNEIRHNRDLFGSYEDYIEEKVTFFKDIANLSYIVTKEAAQSIPYIDEALVMLDSSESVGPYVNQEEFKELRQYYVDKSEEE